MATPTHEPNKWLALGERLRENPSTILLSVPVLAPAISFFWLMGDSNSLAGACGHLGLTFKLYYKHYWPQKFLLKIAYSLFSLASKYGNGASQPTVLMKMGETAHELGDNAKAATDFQTAVATARNHKDLPQAAYALAHLGRLHTQTGELSVAKRELDSAYPVLFQTVKEQDTPRMHIWLSQCEIGLSEWYLSAGDKIQAKSWATKAAARAVKQDLKTRQFDVEKLFTKISSAGFLIVPQIIHETFAFLSHTSKV